ncbi:MAG TPA: nucleotidyltransferase family protein [Ilumatobacteraceae bacterium]|nr:nucleotidyltransferase family protein [Ilumatobacteraceae bacterium]
MNGGTVGLDTLTRAERTALRAVLIRATAAAGRADARDELRPLVDAAPMHALPAAAGLHRVAGTVLRGLDGVTGVPDNVRAELGVRRTQSALHHLRVVGALSQIARVFDEAELSWVVMKGPVVAGLFYPDVGDRTYGDLDLLLDRRDFALGMQLLEDLGYEHGIHNWALAERMLAGQVSLTSPLVSIDLHWHLHYSHEDRRPFAIDPEAMVGRARRVVVSGVNVPTLDPVDTLLMLAFHAARSDGHRLVWHKDVERALAVEQPDLDELVRRCRSARCAPPVGLILARARGLLDAEFPDEIIHALTPVSLRVADRVASGFGPSVQLHDRSTPSRVYTRSVRSSLAATLYAVPERGARLLRRFLRPPRVNESDDAEEKASYLQAVSASVKG